MKLKLKILTFISILFACLFFFTPKTYAASNYAIATQFTFSSDMNIEEGFNLIKPYILYENDTISTKDYTFQATQEGENRYHYSGTYPDGTTFSIHAIIRIKENASGTYVEALKIEPYRQSIYVKGLKENKTANDCLLECWQNRFVTIKDPTYVVSTETTTRIYNHMTTFTISTGEVKNLQYFAMVETKELPSEDLGFPKEDVNTSKPPLPDDEEKENPNPSESKQPDDTTNTPPDSEQTNQGSDPFLAALICLGVLLGLVLIYLIYKGIKALKAWLKK
ncbi:MAG: hypothetical protein K2K48_08060 [Anaeroplasmataceae bacterium]|nr:hypothetical protein [Anaeroplasmataceae bacterium]MDE6415358.1 hypothetical protein [Anaeroplasmataceae bacterium]